MSSLYRCWKRRIAARVFGPRIPSTGPCNNPSDAALLGFAVGFLLPTSRPSAGKLGGAGAAAVDAGGPVGGAAGGGGGGGRKKKKKGGGGGPPMELAVPLPSTPRALLEGAADGADGAGQPSMPGELSEVQPMELAVRLMELTVPLPSTPGAVGGAADGAGGAAAVGAEGTVEVRPMGLGCRCRRCRRCSRWSWGALPSTPRARRTAGRPIAVHFENQ